MSFYSNSNFFIKIKRARGKKGMFFERQETTAPHTTSIECHPVPTEKEHYIIKN
jgi:hypothetical protein